MKLIYQGKTKDVYEIDEDHILLKFKDDMTGTDGQFDPGANTVGLTVEGAGRSDLKMSQALFQLLNSKGINTHFISADIDEVTMKVLRAKVFGNGLEIICRFKAVGSFLRRYGAYCTEGQELDAFVEITIKDDGREDPPITKDALKQLNILTADDYQTIVDLTKKIAKEIKGALAEKGLDLYDIKFEYGKRPDGSIVLIDELSGGNMRVYKDGKYLPPFELEAAFLEA
ncbi:MAG: hypothetical protein M9887_08775 [Chitinophagales bacterium]|nr:hypothetical protein [Chitinophagales bacterium]